MASAGPSFPSSGVDDTTVGTAAWTNPGNITADDGVFATSTVSSFLTTHYLHGSAFGFAIPAGATINGILLEVKQYQGSTFAIENSVKLVKGGAIGGADKSTGASLPASSTYVSYGGASDLWGLAWVPADINAGTFGAVFSATGTTGFSDTVDVDAFRITVYYTVPGGGSFAPQGRLMLSGGHVTSLSYSRPGQLTLSGAANAHFAIIGGSVSPSGQITLSGALAAVLSVAPLGTLRLSGALTFTLDFNSTPAGTIKFSGSCTAQRTVTVRPSGQITLGGSMIVPPVLARRALLIRERPPLRLSADVSTPAGFHQRWAIDEHHENAPSALTFSTTMPGGFEDCTVTLERHPSRSYPDLELLSTVTVIGAGGRIAWQGRIEQLPDTGGDQSQVSAQCVGWQSHLTDDDSAREIFVDRNITSWLGPSVARQIEWLQNPGGAVVANGPSVAPDFSNAYPSLACTLQGSWSQNQVVEGWYDGHGMPIGLLYAAWQTNGAFVLSGGTAFGAGLFLATDDTAVSYDQDNPITVAPGAATLYSTGGREWALVQLWNDTVPGGQDGVSYSLFFTALGVYGAHGLPLQGVADATNALGILASDALAYTIGRWCPKIAYTTGVDGTIQPSAFVIPQLVFLDPTTSSAIIKQAVGYELLDWAVWEEPIGVWPAQPCFYLNERGAAGNSWRARSGPAQLQEAGPQISALWNGVIVQWTDVSGVSRSVGPPGAGTNYTDSSLIDPDPQNPANQDPINRWALVTMGTSTLAGATQIGQLFLQEQKLLNTSGQATLSGYVEDTHGIEWPAWMVRGGDSIVFIDSSYTGSRRIVSTSWDDSSKTNTLQLDQPPDSLAALLQRMSVDLSPVGLS